jgi:NADH-quinone oxidoreductase subunit D
MAEVRTETMTVNMGPQHPSTHGVLRLVLELDGETVVKAVSPTIGFLHTGIEKTAEQKKWQQVIPLVERMDYLGAESNSARLHASSVEQLLGMEMPQRVPGHPRRSSRSCSASAATSCGSARTAWTSAPSR